MFTARRIAIPTLAGALLLTLPARARQDTEMFQDRVVTVGSTEYHFRVFTPKGWSKKKKTPVILFLHGAGERGDDNLAQTKVGIGSAILRQRDTFPFVVVLPQCPRNHWWSEPDMQAQALKALDKTMSEFNCDPARTYLTGLSMGGYGHGQLRSTTPTGLPHSRSCAGELSHLAGSPCRKKRCLPLPLILMER